MNEENLAAEENRDRARFIMSVFFNYLDEFIKTKSEIQAITPLGGDRDIWNLKVAEEMFKCKLVGRLKNLIKNYGGDLYTD